MFTAFTKILKDRDLNKEGVGLGLTVSKNLAVAMGGDITFLSQIGVGSTFTLELPKQQSILSTIKEIANPTVKIMD